MNEMSERADRLPNVRFSRAIAAATELDPDLGWAIRLIVNAYGRGASMSAGDRQGQPVARLLRDDIQSRIEEFFLSQPPLKGVTGAQISKAVGSCSTTVIPMVKAMMPSKVVGAGWTGKNGTMPLYARLPTWTREDADQ